MRFRQWIEIAANAAGDDMNPSGTARATTKAVSHAMQSPEAAKFQSDFHSKSGSNSSQANSFFDFSNQAIKSVPADVANKTSPNHIMHGIQKSMGVPNNKFVSKPSFMKKMKKKMRKS